MWKSDKNVEGLGMLDKSSHADNHDTVFFTRSQVNQNLGSKIPAPMSFSSENIEN